jgi:hypothetical protein
MALVGDAKTARVVHASDLVTTFSIGGGALAATGLVLWLTSPGHHERRVAAAPMVAPGMAGLVMGGRF